MERDKPSRSIAPLAVNGVMVMLKMPRRRLRHSSMSFICLSRKRAWPSRADFDHGAAHCAELPEAGLGHYDRLADANGELAIEPERRRQVEGHAGLERPQDAFVEPDDAPFAPIGGKGDAHSIAQALAEG